MAEQCGEKDFSFPDDGSDLSLVRGYVGDTVKASAMFSDTFIKSLLLSISSPRLTAAVLADMAAAKFIRAGSVKIGRTSVDGKDKAAQFRQLAIDLRKQGSSASGIPLVGMFVGGISRSRRRTLQSDTDRIQPEFALDMDDNPDAGNQSTDPSYCGVCND